jgi:hypothetical protein
MAQFPLRRNDALHANQEAQRPGVDRDGKVPQSLVSRLRQPIESFFNWLIDKTDIQNASTVRSTEGLMLHCFGKLTLAFYLLVFNP